MLNLPPSLPAKPTFQRAETSHSKRTKRTKKKAEREPNELEGPLHTPWIDKLPMTEYESKEQRLHDEIVAFLQYISPSPAELSARHKVLTRLTEVVQRRFLTSEVKIFGSVAQGLSLPGGDVDLVIQTPQIQGEQYSVKKGLFDLSRMLRECAFSSNPFVVAHATVPILTFETTPELGAMKFDININASDGVSALPIIKEYLGNMPALRPLIMVLKAFLAGKGLNSASTGGLGSFSLFMMVVSFLQINPGGRPPEFLTKPMETESLGTLLIDFFKYYSEFPYETSYISVLKGGVFAKESKGWVREGHPEALSIESILDREKDVGKSCGKIRQVRAAFSEALQALQSYTLSVNQGNILGTILGISSKTLEYRKRLKALVDSGDLDKAVAAVYLPPQWGDPPSRYYESRQPGPGRPNRSNCSRYDSHSSSYRRDDRAYTDRYYARGAREPPPHQRPYTRANENRSYHPYPRDIPRW